MKINPQPKYIYPFKAVKCTSCYNLHRVAPTTGASTRHDAMDFATPEGTPLTNTIGTGIAFVGEDKNSGKFVKIRYPELNLMISCSHLSNQIVKDGQTVYKGEIFAQTGHTGTVTGACLHFKVRVFRNGIWEVVNPAEFFEFAV